MARVRGQAKRRGLKPAPLTFLGEPHGTAEAVPLTIMRSGGFSGCAGEMRGFFAALRMTS
jgi:hypothetical protein